MLAPVPLAAYRFISSFSEYIVTISIYVTHTLSSLIDIARSYAWLHSQSHSFPFLSLPPFYSSIHSSLFFSLVCSSGLLSFSIFTSLRVSSILFFTRSCPSLHFSILFFSFPIFFCLNSIYLHYLKISLGLNRPIHLRNFVEFYLTFHQDSLAHALVEVVTGIFHSLQESASVERR